MIRSSSEWSASNSSCTVVEASSRMVTDTTWNSSAVEDAIQQHERPKLDRYQDHYFLTAYAVSLDHDTGTLTTSELAAFATPPALITVRKDPRFDIEGVVARWDGSADLAGHGAARLRRRRALRHRAAAG
jgi:Mg2+ and Co2+ transporter CorA